MSFPAWRKRSANWVGKNRTGAIALFVIAACIMLSPLGLSPGGWGLRGGSSVVEKTVKQLPDGKNEETTNTTITTDSGKTVWDWLSLLGVPLSLALLGAWLQRTQQQQAEAVAKEQREQSESETQEDTLQIYFDRISVLLVDKNLLGIAAKKNISSEQQELLSAAVDVIRARTLSILRRFRNSTEKKTSVIRFLIETEVIAKLDLNLSGADLIGAVLNGANLNGANLSGANLIGADLSSAVLNGANLNGAVLNGANLNGANLSGANLSGANLTGADLSSADLNGAYLSEAYLSEADLSKAKLIEAKLNNADLNNADLSEADLSGANLSNANLSNANLIFANLGGANLIFAHLIFANLGGANLGGANLGGANLIGVKLSGAKLSGATGITKEQLGAATLCNTQLPKDIDLDPDRDCKALGIEQKS